MASGYLAEWYLNWLHGVHGWRVDLATRLEAERERTETRRRLDAEWTAWRAKIDLSTGERAAARLSVPPAVPDARSPTSVPAGEPATDPTVTVTGTVTDTVPLLAASGDDGHGPTVDLRSLAGVG